MSNIRVIYTSEPNFPATDNSPTSVRYNINNLWIDAEGGEPTQEEITAFLTPPPPPQPTLAQLQAQLATLTAQINSLASGS